MKYFDWNKEKNEILKKERKISFEDIQEALFSGHGLDVFEHPNHKKYPSQKVFAVEIEEYVYFVPFVEDEIKIFLKTIYPSGKLTKKYLNKKR